MRYRITTILRPGILDNAGKATTRALKSLGFDDVANVRIGKITVLECSAEKIEKIAKSITNEVMETYKIEEI